MTIEARTVRATTLLHQEGILGLIALVALAFRAGGPLPALRPTSGSVVEGVVVGCAAAALVAAVLRRGRRLPALRRLQAWQARLVSGWTTTDAVSVSVLSGLAEEALMRAVLQPVIGLIAAAALFAVLHVVPDRGLWLWPVLALVLGVGFGLLFERYGYPAAAAAHVTLNLMSIQQLRTISDNGDGGG